MHSCNWNPLYGIIMKMSTSIHVHVRVRVQCISMVLLVHNTQNISVCHVEFLHKLHVLFISCSKCTFQSECLTCCTMWMGHVHVHYTCLYSGTIYIHVDFWGWVMVHYGAYCPETQYFSPNWTPHHHKFSLVLAIIIEWFDQHQHPILWKISYNLEYFSKKFP